MNPAEAVAGGEVERHRHVVLQEPASLQLEPDPNVLVQDLDGQTKL